ncbi:MAG: hypothetical protein EOP60_08250 [Sphingomonadales bacterium]|nr:MAG: hypothetical protein EOP60_08250 [Sphingomonadales bacterium]
MAAPIIAPFLLGQHVARDAAKIGYAGILLHRSDLVRDVFILIVLEVDRVEDARGVARGPAGLRVFGVLYIWALG